jgi:rsbT co-antagonist protein RsbR
MAEKRKKTSGLGTPVNVLWENVLMIPLFGTVDSSRAQEILETVLTKVIETGSKTIILDILGVVTMDSGVANHLIKIVKGCKLLGCQAVISGISVEIAQTLINLGVDLGEIDTTSTLKDAIELTFDKIGLEVVEVKD